MATAPPVLPYRVPTLIAAKMTVIFAFSSCSSYSRARTSSGAGRIETDCTHWRDSLPWPPT